MQGTHLVTDEAAASYRQFSGGAGRTIVRFLDGWGGVVLCAFNYPLGKRIQKEKVFC